jgi:hypothetical protein
MSIFLRNQKYFAIFLWLVCGTLSILAQSNLRDLTLAQKTEIVQSATFAVSDLANQVLQGNYQIAIDKMYPEWKKNIARKLGGLDIFNQKLAGIQKAMTENGVTMLEFKPTLSPQLLEGGVSTIIQGSDSQNQSADAMKWIVIVPTTTRLRILKEGTPMPILIQSKGYQIAITDKDKRDWTFIDGSGLKLSELRELFITIPMDTVLPEVSMSQAK